MGSLLGKDVVEGCMCADSRHVKDVDDFQNLRLLTTSSAITSLPS